MPRVQHARHFSRAVDGGIPSVIPDRSVLQTHDRMAARLIAITFRLFLVQVDAQTGRIADEERAILHVML